MLKQRDYQLRIIYPANSCFKFEEEIKAFFPKQNWTKFIIIRSSLKEMLKTAFFHETKKIKRNKSVR